MKLTSYQGLVIALLTLMLVAVVGFGIIMVAQNRPLAAPQTLRPPTALPALQLPPTWTPTQEATATESLRPSPTPPPETVDPNCPRADVTSFVAGATAILEEMSTDQDAAMALGIVAVLESPSTTAYLAGKTQGYYDDAASLSYPPCLGRVRWHLLEFFRLSYNMYYFGYAGNYQEAMACNEQSMKELADYNTELHAVVDGN